MKQKHTDAKYLREKGIKELLTALLDIKLPGQSRLEKEILYEVLIHHRKFETLAETKSLSKDAQRTLLINGINRINDFLASLEERSLAYAAIESELKAYQERYGDLEEEKHFEKKEHLQQPINELPFSLRIKHACEAAGIHLLGDLLKLSRAQFLGLPNTGKKSLNEIENFINEKGLDWQIEG
jgi:hypothetical protein